MTHEYPADDSAVDLCFHFTGFAQRTTSLLAIAKGASPVTENEFKLFKRAMGEQGLGKSSVADVVAAAHKKGQLDAWGASGGMPVVGQKK